MYQDDEYNLIDGDKGAHVHPTNGVKQGRPLFPLPFSLYINDMGREISEGIKGAVTGDGVNGVLYMLNADDLNIITNDPGEMHVMLNRFQAYAVRKGLTINTSKSEVMHLNGRSCSPLPAFMYRNVALPQKKQFKYHSMLVDRHMNSKVSEEHAVQPYMAAQQRINCVAFWLGCMRDKCGVQNNYDKALAVNQKPSAEKTLMLLEAFSCCEDGHKMASAERMRPRAFAF
eukprot:1148606-Pelagomonas_calceolata.AAC.1